MRHALRAAALLAFAAVALGQPAAPPAPAVVPAGVRAFAALNVAELWDHKAVLPARESRGKLEFAWVVQSMIGVAPTDLDRLTLFWTPAGGDTPFVVLVGRKSLTAGAVATTLSRPGAAVKPPDADGVAVVGGEFGFVHRVDDKTLLLVPTAVDHAKLAPTAALLPAIRAAAGKHTLTLGVAGAELAGIPLDRPLRDASAALLTLDLGSDSASVRLTTHFATPAAATAAEPALATKFRELAALASAQQQRVEARPAEGNAYPAPLLEYVAKTMTDVKVRTAGTAVLGTADVKLDEAVSHVLTALPDPALSPRGASAAENNLKLIALAMHGYHDVHNQFPANIYDKDGTALLSWRVQILPYMEQAALFERFKRDEAWDSPANKAASQSVVRAYQMPGRPTNQPWETYFRTFTSPKNAGEHRALLEDGNPKGPGIFHITDGSSNTFMVVEAGEAVPWAKPDDLPYDGRLPLPRLGGPSGSFAVAMGDGSTRTFRRIRFDDTNLRRAISIADGQVIQFP